MRTRGQRNITVMRIARERLGLTQGQVAEAVGVHQKMISSWENRRQKIPDERRASLAQVLGVSPERLEADPVLSL